MKKTSNRLHSLFAALAALILAAALAVPAFAVEGGFADLYYRMNDSIFSSEILLMKYRGRWPVSV